MSDDEFPGDPDRVPRKDRLVQTRVPRDLETRLKREARRQRVSVSQFIRNVLEDTFSLVDGVLESVDDIVTDSRELAGQLRGKGPRGIGAARRGTGTRHSRQRRQGGLEPVRSPGDGEAEESAPGPGADLSRVQAWNPVILNRTIPCSRCGGQMERGEQGYAGLSEVPEAPTLWLCSDCIAEL